MRRLKQGKCSIAVPRRYPVTLWDLRELGLPESFGSPYVYEVAIGDHRLTFGVRRSNETPEDLDEVARSMTRRSDAVQSQPVSIAGIKGRMLGDYRTSGHCWIWLKHGCDLIDIGFEGPGDPPPELIRETRKIIDSLQCATDDSGGEK